MIILAIVLIAIAVWGISVYNKLVTERMKVTTQWQQIDVVLQQRFDLMPNLVETVKGYAAHEKDTLQAVMDARSGYLGAKGAAEHMKASDALSGAVGKLLAVAEAYPDLKANQNFLQLQQQLTAMEGKLADYRQFYNDTVLRYNSLIATVPNNIIAMLFGFRQEEYFKVEECRKASVTMEF